MSSSDPITKSIPASGPNPPHGKALKPGVHAEIMVKSGPNPPHGGPAPHPVGAGAAAAPAPAPNAQPEAETRSGAVSVRLSVQKAQPFSVFLATPDRNPIQIESLEIEIYDTDRSVFTTALSADLPVVLSNPDESHIFPFTDQQLAKFSQHLKIGNTVEVKIRYLAPDDSDLTIGIVGKESHNNLGTFIEHLFHAK